MRVERDGDLRWLVINRPPKTSSRASWTSGPRRLHDQSNNPKAGLIETDWAENRAKIPESWLRQALGSDAGTGLG